MLIRSISSSDIYPHLCTYIFCHLAKWHLFNVECSMHCWGFIDLCGSTTNDVIAGGNKWQINWVAEMNSFIPTGISDCKCNKVRKLFNVYYYVHFKGKIGEVNIWFVKKTKIIFEMKAKDADCQLNEKVRLPFFCFAKQLSISAPSTPKKSFVFRETYPFLPENPWTLLTPFTLNGSGHWPKTRLNIKT